jgi:hypothetical protein
MSSSPGDPPPKRLLGARTHECPLNKIRQRASAAKLLTKDEARRRGDRDGKPPQAVQFSHALCRGCDLTITPSPDKSKQTANNKQIANKKQTANKYQTKSSDEHNVTRITLKMVTNE